MTIHKEGFATLILTALFLLLLNAVCYYLFSEWPWAFYILSTVSLLFFLAVLSFFRSPKRMIELNEEIILCPADGKVVAIEEVLEDECLKDQRIQISIFMSPANVHVNRYPVGGKISYFKHHNGHFHVAWHPKSSTENERTTTVIKHPLGFDILFRQIAGAVARRIVSYAKVSSTVTQGTECGFIKFGSRVDLFLPTKSRIKVNIGDKVVGGITEIADLPRF